MSERLDGGGAEPSKQAEILTRWRRRALVCILLAIPRMELEHIVRRVREEFREMPGLRLTPAQATRLWGIEHDVCRAVIDALVSSAFLRWTATGAITRAEG
jgi:hypothetical protein